MSDFEGAEWTNRGDLVKRGERNLHAREDDGGLIPFLLV
jgi:hypothetical protein